MKIALQLLETPFNVGDTVFVNLPYCSLDTSKSDNTIVDRGYFEATIVRIFLEGLRPHLVVTEPKATHELAITNLIYDLRPVGIDKGANRVPLNIDLESTTRILFATEQELKDYLAVGIS
ncbi:hypothetical protein ACAW74_18260 [Fibrella sp. WM1]|uniref:hypothetical protein n=1 Tax=Fibrella musci TaxID=3242485 RepID=UPI003520766A